METSFDLENPLPISNDSVTGSKMFSLLSAEADHIPSSEYCQECLKDSTVQSMMRETAIILILHLTRKFDPFLSYLASNYLDRFLSCQPVLEEQPWIFQLVAISCVSLAVKMRKKEEISIMDLQKDGGIMFDYPAIERMEILILGSLKWRMRAITPFSFTNYFITFFPFTDLALIQGLKARATAIVFKAQNEVKLLEFKPSIIAASALLSACHELFPLQFPCFQKAILSCSYVNEDILSSCFKGIQDMGKEDEYGSVLDTEPSADTPANVLDLQYSSSSSSASNRNGQTQSHFTNTTEGGTTGSASRLRQERDLKRRNINGGFGTPKPKRRS